VVVRAGLHSYDQSYIEAAVTWRGNATAGSQPAVEEFEQFQSKKCESYPCFLQLQQRNLGFCWLNRWGQRERQPRHHGGHSRQLAAEPDGCCEQSQRGECIRLSTGADSELHAWPSGMPGKRCAGILIKTSRNCPCFLETPVEKCLWWGRAWRAPITRE
jgi:hypothetical protein